MRRAILPERWWDAARLTAVCQEPASATSLAHARR